MLAVLRMCIDFLALVVAKINIRRGLKACAAAFSAQMEHSVDYREVFSAWDGR